MSPRPRSWATLFTAVLLAISGSAVISPPAHAAIDIPAFDYQQVQLAVGGAKLGEAMSLAVLPNRSIVHTARDGTVRVTTAAGVTKVAGKLNVYTHDEEGLQGVAADPNFATNRYIYLYYSPRLTTPDGDAPTSGTEATFAAWKGHLNLSRFTLKADDTLDLASEKIVMEMPNDRGQCCHVGGDIDFDAAGNLYLTTGDDTNPFESNSYAPIDERTDRNPQFDAQRSSANTNDLRGKLLRIHPEADGTYTIPAGNLFAPGTAKTRPEIYAMGFRNPFRMSVDKPTGIVYLGDYGPDAGGPDAGRGPGGQVEFDRITAPGNYGWPYCTGTNTTAETYNEYTFPSGPSAAKYDCAGGPTNNSFRNTGLDTLPPAKASWIRYGGEAGTPPEFGGGSESPMGGPVYRYDADLESNIKFPASLNGRYFAGELGRQWIKAIEVKADGAPGEISAFPWTGKQVMDMAFGPDGALYVLDYGTNSDDQALYRVEYLGGTNRNPIAKVAANKTSGPTPLTVTFSSAGSSDPEAGALTYAWDFGDGGTSTEANPTHTYEEEGTYTPTLTVKDAEGLAATASVIVTVGNTAPTVNLTVPADGQLFSFGDTVPFTVNVTDPEDGTIDCTKVNVDYLLGHDSHRHLITSKGGCTGSIVVPTDGEHDAAANIYGVLVATYTDKGGLTGESVRTLQPRHRQAEHFAAQSGIQVTDHGPAEGSKAIGFTDNNDWISFQPYALGNANTFTARVASAGAGGTIEVRTGSATGTLLGTATVPITGGWDTFVDVSADLSNAPSGSTTLFLVFKGPSGRGNLYDVDSFTFGTSGSGGGSTKVEGESFTSNSGLETADHGSASGGKTVGFTDDGDWAGYAPVDVTGVKTFTARVSSDGPGGTIEIRAGSETGTVLGSVNVANTGDWDTFVDVSTNLTNVPSGPTSLFLVFKGVTGQGNLFDVDTFTLGTGGGEPSDDQLLVFSKTAGFRHDAIPAGIKAIQDLAETGGYSVTATEDAGAFTAANLAKYKAVVFLSTTGDVLNDTQQAAFEAYVDGGGGYFGVHAAADTEYDWPYYGKLVGAYFKGHPAPQQATVKNEDRTHPATTHLGATWSRFDEWYNYRSNPRGAVHVLQSLDESSYSGGEMSGDHPITWCHTQGKGRSFYTGLGHTQESYTDSDFRKLLVGGIRYTMGLAQGDCSADTVKPTVSAATTPATPDGAAGWFVSSVSVAVTAQDASGIAKTEINIDGGPWTAYSEPVSLTADGSHTVAYRATDKAGNIAEGTIEVKKDATAPLTTAQFAGAGDDGWHGATVPVTLAATDATSGAAGIEYSLDDGGWKPYTEPVNISGDGTHALAYRAKDKAGNVETEKAATVKIDGTRPTVLISGISDGQIYGDSQDLRISWQAVDSTSGVKTLTGTLDTNPYQSGLLRSLYEMSLSTHALKVTATDNAGNRTNQTVTFGVTTSTRDLGNLIDRFAATSRLSQKGANKLHNQLTKVLKAEVKGNNAKTVKALEEFRSVAVDATIVTVEEVRQVLARDTDALIARLS